jgi:hypothetical protein
MKYSHFEYCKNELDQFDKAVAFWTEFTRPLCIGHEPVREVSWWTFIKRSWKMVDRCPKCQGYYTKWGYPSAPKNMLDKMLTVHYGPALRDQLNRTSVYFDKFGEKH